ncbi:conjugative transposon protein TraM [Pedobacter gandavensis]|uniref:conjugative transposon protein TraM n=1 Tax=Pedobacter gandavensis TaxID=2679963 RepID=UPI00247A0076|nr:conjugative transposon protein TraM [Pedobacter gandavensis]WGQ08986.1 conjugative transposon protein TraM [Pedobacter gandavensis]
MKIDLKKPKYVIPIILLPFLCIFFYVYKSSFGKETQTQAGRDSLQVNLAGVSDQVKNRALSDKLEAYRDQYKQSDGYTAVGQIQEEQVGTQTPSTLYNEREKRMLDSIDKLMKAKYQVVAPEGRAGAYSGFPDAVRTARKPNNYDQQDKALATALSKMNQQPQVSSSRQQTSPQIDPMQIFRQQMALVDSIGKANDPDYKSDQQQKKNAEMLDKELKERKKLTVSKSGVSTDVFNTITADKDETLITAIIDQDITGYAGSRLRIRLLEDLMAGRFLIKKGTYVYAQISGFSGQRVNLTVSSIMTGNNILPVKLDIYDHDGLPGMYVPASAFREFSKELGSNSSQGVTLQQMAENNDQMVMSMIQKMFQSTTTAISKIIRQNKARLKYNSLVYLIDPDELKNNQKNY